MVSRPRCSARARTSPPRLRPDDEDVMRWVFNTQLMWFQHGVLLLLCPDMQYPQCWEGEDRLRSLFSLNGAADCNAAGRVAQRMALTSGIQHGSAPVHAAQE